jgi:hypothetical protein
LRESDFDDALIADDHIATFELGKRDWVVGERVFVTPAPPSPDALLWRDGRLGGWVTIVEWKRCGGKSHSWHGVRAMQGIPWRVEEEDASILVLHYMCSYYY